MLGSKVQSSFNQGFNTANKSIEKLTSNLKTAAGAYISFKGAQAVVTSMASAASSLESYRGTLNVVMKDQKKAAETMAWAVQFANRTPFETESVVEATVKLESYGLKATDVMTSIGDMAGVMNKDLIQAVEAVADAQNGELERLKEFGITKKQIIEYGQNELRMMNLVNNKGQIVDQEKFNQALFGLMDSRFKGGMEQQAGMFKGLMSTVTGVWKTGLATMSGVTMTGEVVDGSLFDMIKANTEQVAKFLTRQIDNGNFERAGQKIAAFFKFVGYGIDLAKAGMKKAWPYIKKTGKIVESMIHLTVKTIQKLKPNLSTVGTKVDWLKNAFMNGFNKVKLILEQNQSKLIAFKDAIVNLTKSVKNGLSNAFDYAKPFISWMFETGLPLVATALSGVIEFATNLYDHISSKWGEIQPIFETVGNALKDGLLKAFELIQPLIEYLVSDGLPFVSELLGAVIESGFDLYNLINDNWVVIEPVVVGITTALITYKTVMLAVKVATMAQTAWTTALAIATGALSTAIAVLTSPVTAVIAAIGVLAAAAFAVWKNWDEILAWFKEKFELFGEWVSPVTDAIGNAFQAAVDLVKNAWSGIGEFFNGLWDGVIESGKGFINFFIEGINWVIDSINKLSFTVPHWVPNIGGEQFGFDIQHIPLLAKGGVTNGPTLAMIGEGKEQEAVLPLSVLKGLFELAVLRAAKMNEKNESDYNPLEKRVNDLNQYTQNNSSISFVYAPNITVEGNGDKKTFEQVLEQDKKNFKQESKKMFDQRERLAFK